MLSAAIFIESRSESHCRDNFLQFRMVTDRNLRPWLSPAKVTHMILHQTAPQTKHENEEEANQ